jgi:hypothetical protein
MESETIKPTKRVYVKKEKVVEPIPEIIENNESKPKRTYTKKKKEDEILPSGIKEKTITSIEETPIEEEKKPKRVYIKKNKVVQENNIFSINAEIDIIQKDLDKLKINEEIEIQECISNNNEEIEIKESISNNIQDNNDSKRKFEYNIVQEAKKPTLYTQDIDIDLNLYIYDKFFDGSKKNKKSILQISSFISTKIDCLEPYITKFFNIKSNNNDIKVCYLGSNIDKELIKCMGDYNIETKLFIDNNTHKNVYDELISTYNKNKKDFIYFKKYIIEVIFYDIYSGIY